jgi:hypothetical protein
VLKRLIIQSTVIVIIVCLFSSTGLAQEKTAGELSAEKGVICLDVIDREPIGAGDIFPKEVPRLFCFTKIVGAEIPTSVTHLWYQNGMLKAKVSLPVNSVSWRTWSSMEMSPDKIGHWLVEVISEDGVALDSIVFIIK